MEYSLSSTDRARIDNLLKELAIYNGRNERADGEVLVSCQEAARLLGVTPPTISVMLGQRRLTKVTIGPSTGIRLSEIRSIQNSQ